MFDLNRYPFSKFLPVPWEPSDDAPPVYSLARTHGLTCALGFHHFDDPINRDRDEMDRALLSYEINGRRYDLYTVSDLDAATYGFDEKGTANLIGDLAERIARRIMKRFLQIYGRGMGKLGGLFDQRFDPKKREGYVVAHSQEHVLKIGKYPNLVLLKRTGKGKWGYQHVTDLDGLFDFRSANKRHMIIIESKSGRIDIDPTHLIEETIVPLESLFPGSMFTYVLFADKTQLIEARDAEYRILQDAPLRLYHALSDAGIPSFFFDFRESEREFKSMSRHLINVFRTLHDLRVTFSGSTVLTRDSVDIFAPGSDQPYVALKRDPKTGMYRLVRSPYRN